MSEDTTTPREGEGQIFPYTPIDMSAIPQSPAPTPEEIERIMRETGISFVPSTFNPDNYIVGIDPVMSDNVVPSTIQVIQTRTTDEDGNVVARWEHRPSTAAPAVTQLIPTDTWDADNIPATESVIDDYADDEEDEGDEGDVEYDEEDDAFDLPETPPAPLTVEQMRQRDWEEAPFTDAESTEHTYAVRRIRRHKKLIELHSCFKDFEGHVRKGRIKPEHFERLQTLYNLADTIFPGNVDIIGDPLPRYTRFQNQYGNQERFLVINGIEFKSFYLVIRFPEVAITNGRSNHVIRDLFIRFEITIDSRNKVKLAKFYGTRSTFTIQEVSSGYVHSHLTARKFEPSNTGKLDFESFCTNSGDIDTSIAMFNSESRDSEYGIDGDFFIQTLYQAQNYVEWESLDGVPYISIETIGKGHPPETASRAHILSIYNTIFSTARDHPEIVDLDWNYRNGQYILKENEKFDNFFRNVLARTDSRASLNHFMYYRRPDGSYYRQLNVITEENIRPNPETDYVLFQGEKILFKLEGTTEVNTNQPRYLAPEIKAYVKQQLEYKANKAQIRATAIARANTPRAF